MSRVFSRVLKLSAKLSQIRNPSRQTLSLKGRLPCVDGSRPYMGVVDADFGLGASSHVSGYSISKMI